MNIGHSNGRHWQFTLKALLGAVLVVALLFSAGKTYLWWLYPMGSEHRCDTLLWLVLSEYAEKHGDAFPAGEPTPEASISLVHALDKSGREYASLLHRRDVPVTLVQDMLSRGQLLDASTCGWNYVEGLRVDSSSKLALFWDKEGLGHNGQRLSGGGHIVTFVGGMREHIPAARWEDFLVEQRTLLAEEKARTRNAPQPPAAVR